MKATLVDELLAIREKLGYLPTRSAQQGPLRVDGLAQAVARPRNSMESLSERGRRALDRPLLWRSNRSTQV